MVNRSMNSGRGGEPLTNLPIVTCLRGEQGSTEKRGMSVGVGGERECAMITWPGSPSFISAQAKSTQKEE